MRFRTLPSLATIFVASAMLASLSGPVSSVIAQDEKAEAAEKDAKPASDVEPIGYFLGLSVGQQMSQNGFKLGDFDIEAMITGFKDGMNKKDAVLNDDQLRDTQKKIQEMLGERREAMVTEMKAKGAEWLAKNKEAEGVEVTASGLQYKVIEAGEGDSPGPTDTVKVHYTGKLIDGTVFDSSRKRGEPATFRVNQVIKGWQEGLQQMKEGSKYMLYVPSDLGYGAQGSPGAIGPHQVLIFEVELLEIQ